MTERRFRKIHRAPWRVCGTAFLVPLLAVLFLSSDARAETSTRDDLNARISALEAAEAARTIPEEVQRARELWRQAVSAQESGQEGVAEGLVGLILLQLQLIDEILRAIEAEGRADEAERRALEARGTSQVGREAVERVLERLVALSILREEE